MRIEFHASNRALMPMMRGRYVDRIRVVGTSGRLTAAGAQWIEPDVVKTIGCILAAVPFMGLAIWSVVQAGSSPDAWLQGLPFLAIGFGLLAVALMAKKDRTLVFHDDGRIAIPHGLTGWGGHTMIEGSHQHVASIEAEQVPPNEMLDGEKGARVVMFSRGGDTIYVTGNRLRIETARKIAVQLGRALKDLRDSVAGSAAGPSATDDGRPVLID